MKYRSVFDIIGPIMVGPSSSHTAGAARIGLFTRNLFNEEPKNIEITLYGSFKDTYKGHGTDIALIGGLLGYDTFDKKIKKSLETAKKKGITYKFIKSDIEHIHPNTAKIIVEGNGDFLEVIGKSIGGGKMVIFEIQGFDVEITADFNTIFVFFEESILNRQELEKILMNIELEKYRFSNSIIESKSLLTIETRYNVENLISTLNKLSLISNIKFSKSL